MANRSRRASKRAAPRKRTAASTATQASANTAFELTDTDIEQALQTGAYAGLLEDYFGPENYAELRQLKREATARAVRGGPRVLILPGIMGSKIGKDRTLIDDVTWVDPIGIAAGHLKRLALPDGGKLKALGVILLAYLKLKLRLQRDGYDAQFHPFDWRKSVAVLGKELKDKLDKMDGKNTALVAHSMGGLVSRAAIAQGARFKKLIMLGTPNSGSFAPVLALRGTYPVVRKIAWLDTKHSAEELASAVFSTFPGLTQMLPFKGVYNAVDLYDLNVWPEADKGCAPRPDILREAPDVQKSLAAGDERMFMIAGINQNTVVGVRLPEEGGKDLTYEFSPEGDGTVPLQFALLAGVKRTYYIAESHGSLPNNAIVASAVADLLERDETAALPDSYERPADRRAVELVPESRLRVEPYEGRRGRTLSQSELRGLISEVVSADTHEALSVPPPVAGATGQPLGTVARFEHRFDRIRVGRNSHHRIDLRFASGSITEADTRVIALGVFADVVPTGAARALDLRMGGAITDIFQRRMFSAHVGEIFMLPTGRHQLIADLLAFVGLGPFDRFSDEVLQTAAENLIRTLISARIEELSTVLFGGGSGESPASALRALLTGFLKGLTDADRDHHFRRIVICEQNRERYLGIKEELYRLSSTPLCEGVELTFDEVVLGQSPRIDVLPERVVRREDPAYLIVRQERTSAREIDIRSSILTVGSKATVITGVRTVAVADFEQARGRILGQTRPDFTAPGRALAQLILAEPVLAVLPTVRQHPLVVVHDGPMSRIPWETLAFGDGEAWFPAAERGLTHHYAADNMSVAKWLEERVDDNVLNVLLVVNPTEDLEGAEEEGERIRELLGRRPGCQFKELRHGAATRPALLSAFNSGEFDIIHYAGHAEFDESAPARSGLVCANDVRLTGAELAGLARLPTLVFFNACEAARVRGRRSGKKVTAKKSSSVSKQKQKEREEHLRNGVGLAEAFMRGGVANFIGTYWPVGDAAAGRFAESFYKDLVGGKTLGEAIREGRAAVRKLGSRDWANYTFYGNADFKLKESADAAARSST